MLLTGLPAQATEEGVAAAMRKLGPVDSVQIVREGNAETSWAVIEMPITHDEAFRLTQRVQRIWHDGQYVSLSLMNR